MVDRLKFPSLGKYFTLRHHLLKIMVKSTLFRLPETFLTMIFKTSIFYKKPPEDSKMTNSEIRKNKRVKVGAILDEDVVKIIKDRASREGKTISDVVQEAIIYYNRTEPIRLKFRSEAAKRLLTSPFTVSPEQLNQDIEEDYYDQ